MASWSRAVTEAGRLHGLSSKKAHEVYESYFGFIKEFIGSLPTSPGNCVNTEDEFYSTPFGVGTPVGRLRVKNWWWFVSKLRNLKMGELTEESRAKVNSNLWIKFDELEWKDKEK